MAIKINNTVVIDNSSHCIIGSGTTAERPASPPSGTLWFNTTLNVLEGYNGSTWVSLITT